MDCVHCPGLTTPFSGKSGVGTRVGDRSRDPGVGPGIPRNFPVFTEMVILDYKLMFYYVFLLIFRVIITCFKKL